MKNKFLKIIAVWTFYIFASSSVFWVISLQDNKDPISNFWVIQSIDTEKVYADDDYEDDNYKSDDDDDDRQKKKNTTNVIPKVTTNTISSSSQVSSSQVCTTVYDTVTSASWTTSQVPRQSCTEKIITPTISNPVTPVIQNITPKLEEVVQSINTWIYNDWVYTGTGKYLFTWWSISYTVSIEISGWKINKAEFIDFTDSWNWKYTRAQGEQVLSKLIWTSNSKIDTISGASWTSVAIQDAVMDALNKAKKINTTSSKLIETNIKLQDTSYTAPNKKVYKLHLKNDNKYTFIRPDWTISNLSFNSESEVKSYIYKNNHDIKIVKSVTASNWKKFTIIQDITAWNYYFKREDWTVSNIYFDSVLKTVIYIIKNNVKESISLYKWENWKTYTIIEKWSSVTIKKSDWTYALKSFTNREDAINYLKQNTKKSSTPKKVNTIPVSLPKKTSINTTTVKPTVSISKTTTTQTKTPVITIPKVTTPQTPVIIPKIDTTTKAS